jgi:hypothetical protein
MGFEPQKPQIKRYCPFISGQGEELAVVCLKEKCALWCRVQKCCSFLLIATSLGRKILTEQNQNERNTTS